MIDRTKASAARNPSRAIRIGAVSYLNSKPLIEELPVLLPRSSGPNFSGRKSGAELILDVPSRLADRLASGDLDIALIPSVESFANPDYEIVSDACVATRGPVLSVKLYCRVPPGEIRSLALDEGSRTSAALARIMLAERYGIIPHLERLPLAGSVASTSADAILLIGDRAMHAPPGEFHTIWDLGEEWLSWTGLPFVFAMWVARPGVDLNGIDTALAAARDLGVTRAAEIAKREARGLGLSVESAHRYLTENLCFRLQPAERYGLSLFHSLAVDNGLIPQAMMPRFHGEPASLHRSS